MTVSEPMFIILLIYLELMAGRIVAQESESTPAFAPSLGHKYNTL
jgi:hypothetical protein